MPRSIARDEVRELIEQGAQLVEVLPREEYEEAHLPGAINVPLKVLNREATAQLRQEFSRVYDYAAGKADWSASGRLMEGTSADAPNIGDAARRAVPTCGPAERVGDVRDRTRRAGWDRCVVVNEERVVLGLLREKELSSDPDADVEAAMRNGPDTFRPDEPVEKIAKRMRERRTSAVLVTTPDGRLVGAYFSDDAQQLRTR